MSGYLWKYYLDDDVESFRQLLESANYVNRASASKGHGSNIALGVGSPGSLGTSPTFLTKTPRKSDTYLTALGTASLTRADVNRRDALGRTLLHLAASSTSENAFAFATALLEQPLTDIYIQDLESGWTALHRAFYHGNISIACAILNRDTHDTLGPGATGFLSSSMGLIKIKDREGNGPLDLFANTLESDRLGMSAAHASGPGPGEDDEDRLPEETPQVDVEYAPETSKNIYINLRGDEVFTFGSNRNVTLGFGDEDDRQYPERITLRRPDHLLQRLYAEHLEAQSKEKSTIDGSIGDLSASQSIQASTASLPSVIRSKPIVIQDVYMAKFSTAVLTTDPEANLYMCGHGQGGRLGTGDERTRFQFVCIEGGALAGRKIVSVALGQNHTLAISEEGDIFSWGNNGFGQLGYALPKSVSSDEDPTQTVPRQIFGTLKREIVVGVAASRIHSVAHTLTSLYTFGKNEGQLGIVDSEARSLESQVIPRRVAASLFSSNIASVAAIDRATICLLENHEVYVFANYGYAKVQFTLDSFTSHFSQQSFTATRYEVTPNRICKITAGGNTICAMSSAGEIYTITVNQPTELAQNISTSTTNPVKIRGALSQAHRIWDLRKSHMAARDVGVDQDGSIILTTDAGSVWRRVRRTKISTTASQNAQYKAKDYKFSRIPGLTRAMAVRSSAHGAYAAVRKDCTVTRTQIEVDASSLWTDLFKLLPFREMAEPSDDSEDENPPPRFWNKPSVLDNVRRRVMGAKDAEKEVQQVLDRSRNPELPYNIRIKVATSEVAIPLHEFMLTGRSRVLRRGLAEFRETGDWSIPDLLSIETGDDGIPTITLYGVDFLSVFDLVLYLYGDLIVEFWGLARLYPKLAFRYRSIRTEMLKVATAFEMTELERGVRIQVPPLPAMNRDLELAVKDDTFFEDGDVLVQLADTEVLVHSGVLCRRCPFFEGLFIGRAGGQWLSDRRDADVVNVDLKHIESSHFMMVLRHIYADTGEELFNNVVADSLDEFLDVVIAVMGVANELMLDRLSQICQKIVGKYGLSSIFRSMYTTNVTVRNISQLLNAVAPCSVTEFKDKGLEYVCLNLEALLAQGLLNELDEDLLFELDDVVRMVQLRCSEVTRSGALDDSLREAHPELEALIEAERRAKVDYMMLQTRHFSTDRTGSLSTDNFREFYETPGNRSPRLRPRTPKSPVLSTGPILSKKQSTGDFMFAMDEDGDELTPLEASSMRKHHRAPSGGLLSRSPIVDDDQWYDSRGKKIPSPGQSVSPSAQKTPVGSPAATSLSPSLRPVDPNGPWGRSPLASKLDLKGIMAQASSSRTSSISLALSAQVQNRPKLPEDQLSGSFQTKQSQKERKKMQQVQAQQPKSAPIAPVVTTPSASPADSKRGNPWQTVQRPKAPVKDIPKAPSPAPSNNSAVSRSVTAPILTMRQTVARTGSTGKQKATEPAPSPRPDFAGPWPDPSGTTKAPLATPSPSRPHSTQLPAQSKTTIATSSQATPPPAIQSIRHTPNPRASEPTTGLSMADILSQQLAEKTAIREAATAKRSLQEIQQEQEFQEWWDMESRKVMEEERERERQARRDEKGTRGGRGKGKRGRGSADAGSRRDSSGGPAATEDKSRGDGGQRGRGSHRGRGRGGARGKVIGPGV
ncbi:hypothetical protein NA57DRAFT_39896 [Rhizodiscina lignyota]|uniref:BTB domain-containing protein n=1 Tax=Rhizodiscina lignyota TaxID=1504668 RepID=A0A9P4IFE4_9PEZI|nr:hypothetical protein NA57DRAFT_39896 [Rhizodiscina lignyota]